MPDDPRPASETSTALIRGAPGLSLSGIAAAYGGRGILHDIDLAVERGRFLVLVGPSGCGKTTLLKLLAGLVAPAAGSIRIGDRPVADAARRLCLPPEQRDIGMVFQDYALWPHLSVRDNVGFPLAMRRVAKAERAARIAEALAQVGLSDAGARFPAELSGGQQQRVALARAVVARPGLILFDEPLSNLDKELRDTLGMEMAGLCRSLGLTAVYVTHDLGEAFALGDEIAVMRDGTFLQVGAPEHVVAYPASLRVAEFLKLGAILPAVLSGGYVQVNGVIRLPPPDAAAPDGPGALLVPPAALKLAPMGRGDLQGTVVERQFRGDGYLLAVRLSETAPLLHLPSAQRVELGARIALAIDPDRLRWFAGTP